MDECKPLLPGPVCAAAPAPAACPAACLAPAASKPTSPQRRRRGQLAGHWQFILWILRPGVGHHRDGASTLLPFPASAASSTLPTATALCATPLTPAASKPTSPRRRRHKRHQHLNSSVVQLLWFECDSTLSKRSLYFLCSCLLLPGFAAPRRSRLGTFPLVRLPRTRSLKPSAA